LLFEKFAGTLRRHRDKTAVSLVDAAFTPEAKAELDGIDSARLHGLIELSP
jgi:hypothetical protein